MIEAGPVGTGQVVALLVAAVELGAVIYAVIRRPRRGRHWAGRCEEVIVRQRLAGQIDAATYQTRMTDLVRARPS